MSGFFKGRRRKAGLGLLAMALLLTVPWVRSYSNCDSLLICDWQSKYSVASSEGCVVWLQDRAGNAHSGVTKNGWHFRFESYRLDHIRLKSRGPIARRLLESAGEIEWFVRWGEFKSGGVPLSGSLNGLVRTDFAAVPYWLLVLSLTLLSAYLLLTNPQASRLPISNQDLACESN